MFLFVEGFLAAPGRFHGLCKLHVSFCAEAVFDELGTGLEPASEAFHIHLNRIGGFCRFHFTVGWLAPDLFPNDFHVLEELGVQGGPGRGCFWFGERHRMNGLDGSLDWGSWKGSLGVQIIPCQGKGPMLLSPHKSTRTGGVARLTRLPVTEKFAGSNPVRSARKPPTCSGFFFCFRTKKKHPGWVLVEVLLRQLARGDEQEEAAVHQGVSVGNVLPSVLEAHLHVQEVHGVEGPKCREDCFLVGAQEVEDLRHAHLVEPEQVERVGVTPDAFREHTAHVVPVEVPLRLGSSARGLVDRRLHEVDGEQELLTGEKNGGREIGSVCVLQGSPLFPIGHRRL